MLKTTRSQYKGIAIMLSFFLLMTFSCKKEPQDIGLNLVGNNPFNVEISDTTTLVAYSLLDDSIRTDETQYSLLGSIYDPVFGKTTASIYSQISMALVAPDFGTNPQCDSMILSIAYAGYYGDTLTPQTVKIYELADSLEYDTSYYAGQTVAYDPTLLAEYTFTPYPTDTVWIDSIAYAAHLRVPMNTILGNKILTASTDVLADNNTFKEYIKGIYMTTDPQYTPGSGAILYLNFYSTISKINIYYHNDSTDSLVYRVSISNTSLARFGNFNHYGYADAAPEFQNQLLNGDTTLGSQLLYLQSMGGVKTIIRFPYLLNWIKDQKIAINEAQLIIKNDDPESTFNPPSSLALFSITDEGKLGFLPDQFESALYYDGNYVSNGYRFRISRYIQDILINDINNNGLYMMISGASLNANRIILNGSGNTDGPLMLRLIYTRLND
jgi:hypothetical protein